MSSESIVSPEPPVAGPETPARLSTLNEKPVTVRRSSGVCSFPSYYRWSSHLVTEEPDSVKEAMKAPQWLKAMHIEMDSLKEHEIIGVK